MDFIVDQLGDERIEEFRKFLARDGQVALCPYFDERAWGCGIYNQRPFSCRVFGHYREESTSLPDVCVFRGQEKIFAANSYYESVPQAAELRDLVRRFWPMVSPSTAPDGSLAVGKTGAEVSGGDGLDRALILQHRGSLSKALSELNESDLERTPYFLYVLSLVLEGMERHAEAAQALREGLDEAPESAALWFRYGCNLYAQGHCESAESAFREAVSRHEGHASAQGMLGAHCLRSGRLTEAVLFLRRAQDLDPDNPVFGRLLDSAMSAGGCGQNPFILNQTDAS